MFEYIKNKKERVNYKRLSVFLLITLVILSSAAVNAAGIDKIGKLKTIGPANMSSGTILQPGKMAIGIKYLSFSKDQLYAGENEISGNYNGKLEQEQDVVLTGIRYGINKKMDIRLNIPYYKKDLKRRCYVGSPKSDVIKTTNNGLGDINMMGRYSLLSQKKGDSCSLAVGLGMKIPTGDSDKKNPLPFSKKYEYLGPGFQLGTGSWDPKLELGFTKNYLRSRIDSHLMYTWGNQGKHGLEKGDVFKYNLAYSYALSKIYDLQLELNGIKADKSLNNNEIVTNSGGDTIFLTPGIHFKLKNNYNISVAVPITIYRDLNADAQAEKFALGEDYRVVIKASHLF